jgi:hypothetical protein
MTFESHQKSRSFGVGLILASFGLDRTRLSEGIQTRQGQGPSSKGGA